MRILAAEPYAAPSHQAFLEGLAAHSKHELVLATLPARTWKWRMRTASFHYAKLIENEGPWDLIFASDYLNLAETIALLPPGLRRLPAVVYFHENQLTYPLQGTEERDVHHALTHIHACMTARKSLFNSDYHRSVFTDAVRELLAKAPDLDLSHATRWIEEHSSVLPLGTDLNRGEPSPPTDAPVILWPHRWEYDKNPAAFLAALVELERMGVPFRLRLAGQRFRARPPEFDELEARFRDRIEPGGFLERADYLRSLNETQLVISTAHHEFFGLGTLEAIRAGAFPVLPRSLAYPELISPSQRDSGLFLYDADELPTETLARAIESVRSGSHLHEREELIRFTDRFQWEELAPEFDAIFTEAAGS